MISFLIYGIKFSICMLLAFIPYQLFMRRSTFFAANRFWLISAIALSIVIPLIKVSLTHVPVNISSGILNEWMEEGTVALTNIPIQSRNAFFNFDWLPLLPYLYLLVSSFLFFRFSMALVRLYIAYRRSEIIRQNKMIVLVSEKQHLPFSFFRFVFLCRSDFENENNRLILIHEQAHLRLLHSIDLLFLEILQLIFWINPMIIVYRRALRLQHEYQVDKIVLQETNDYSGYLDSLAKIVSNGLYTGISNGFYCSTLKKRIQMIGYKTSKKIALLRYLLIIPISLIMLLAFTRPETAKFFTIKVPGPIVKFQSNDIPSIVPVDESKAVLASGWGNRSNPLYKTKQFHYAADWKAPIGSDVYATANGIVAQTDTSNKDGLGYVIILQHGAEYSTVYAHLSGFAIKAGEQVKKGQVIGYVGNTGKSTGPHLHYQVLKNGKAVDPAKYYQTKIKTE